jgi:hypothetical protein
MFWIARKRKVMEQRARADGGAEVLSELGGYNSKHFSSGEAGALR